MWYSVKNKMRRWRWGSTRYLGNKWLRKSHRVFLIGLITHSSLLATIKQLIRSVPQCKCPQISSSNQGRTLSKVMPAEGRGGWMGLALGFGLATVHWFPTLGSNTGCFMQNYWNIRPLSSIKSTAFPKWIGIYLLQQSIALLVQYSALWCK